jgi:DNA-directed RNA polymerase subunit H (RpoH/RPB5)
MSVNPLLLPIKKDNETIKKEVLTNIVKMLSYRNWINKDKIDEIVRKLISTNVDSNTENTVYEINLDINLHTFDFYDEIPETNKDFNPKKVFVKLLNQKITGVNKSPQITEFFNTYKDYHKILVVDNISDKPEQLIDDMKYTEVFEERHLLINLPDYSASSQYEVLNKQEIDEFLKSYQVKKNKLPKIYQDERASRYLYVKVGQILRIIRNSEVSGQSISYRIVKKGNVNL